MNVVKVFLVVSFIGFSSLLWGANSEPSRKASSEASTADSGKKEPETVPYSLCFSEKQWKSLPEIAAQQQQLKDIFIDTSERGILERAAQQQQFGNDYLISPEQWIALWEILKRQKTASDDDYFICLFEDRNGRICRT